MNSCLSDKVIETCEQIIPMTSMGMSVSVLAHLAMKRVLQVIARLKFILRVSYDAMLPYAVNGLNDG